MSTASKWAGWDRYRGSGTPSPFNAGTAEELSPRVELLLGETWVDITRLSKDQAGVYYRDRITITRGKADEAGAADPQTCTFTLNNRDGRFSLHNPRSPYYGLITRNTQCRVSVMQNGIRRYRFHGEISSWPTKSDISGRDVYVPITASGIKRRLQQGTSPLKSAVYRDMTSPTRTAIVAYWPMEDAAGATSIASGLDGGTPMRISSGAAEFGAYTDFAGSGPLPTMGTGVARVAVPPYEVTGSIDGAADETSIRFFCKVNEVISTTYQELIRFKTTGSAYIWWLSLKNDGALRLISKDRDDFTLIDTGDIAFGMNTAGMRMITIEITFDSGTLDLDVSLITTDFTNTMRADESQNRLITGGTAPGETMGRITDVVLNTSGGLGQVALGHVSIATAIDAYAFSGRSMVAWNDEAPSARFSRLCGEEGVNSVVVSHGQTGNDVTLGNQHADTLVTLWQDCADTDFGMLYEQRDQLGPAYRTRLSLYNQDPRLMLDHSQHQLADSLNPVDDDQAIRNDLTIARRDGSSARQVLMTGPMSVLDPPDGVGRYDDAPPAISLGFDDQLADQVGWRLLLGTVDEARYPQIALNLRHRSFAGDLDLMNAALTLDIGDRITIDNPPDWLPPDQIDLLVQGYTETFDQVEYNMVINCSPGSPYRVAVVDDDELGRVDTDGSVLAAAVTESSIGTITFVNSAATLNSVAADNVVVSVPSGTTAGDVMIARIGLIGQVAITAPDGWELVGSADAGTAVRYAAYVRVAGASEPATYTWTWTGSPFKNSGQVAAYRGVDTIAPVADAQSTGANLSGTSVATTPVSAPERSVLDVGVFERHAATGSTTTWTDIDDGEKLDHGTNAGSGQDISHAAYASAALTAGSVSRTLTASQTVTLVVTWAIALRPASTLSVATTAGAVWTTDPADFPFDVRFGGEDATVTAITGSTSPQTFTVVRGVNGVLRAHDAGTDVRLAQPSIIPL